jgi:hypothetical protein
MCNTSRGLRSDIELIINMISSDITHGSLTSLKEGYQSYILSYVSVSTYTRLWDTALDYSGLRSGSQPLLPTDKMSTNYY